MCWSQISVFDYDFSGTDSFQPFDGFQGVSLRLASTCGIEATLVALDFFSNTILGTRQIVFTEKISGCQTSVPIVQEKAKVAGVIPQTTNESKIRDF